jgi:hypothetical protein
MDVKSFLHAASTTFAGHFNLHFLAQNQYLTLVAQQH